MSQPQVAARGRLDHLLPRGYLEGFTDPSKPGQLSVYDVHRQRWFESGTARVAAIKGFYDYSSGSSPDQTADQAFQEFEDRFPNIRRELAAAKFSEWKSHLEFLLRYAQMLRVRSELYREQSLADIRTRSMFRLKEPVEGKANTYEFEFLTEDEGERETLFRNMTITNMREEIAKGAAFFSRLHWCLRLTMDAVNPVITSDNAVIVDGKAPTLAAALEDERTLFFFPICWEACLIGSLLKFDVETEAFHPLTLRTVQSLYLKPGSRFAYAPKRLSSLGLTDK